MLLQIDLMKLRVEELCRQTGPTDRHKDRQPEQMQAIHICDSVQRGIFNYPQCWDVGAAESAGIESATDRDLEVIRQIVHKRLDSIWSF